MALANRVPGSAIRSAVACWAEVDPVMHSSLVGIALNW
jgi:hypothetical protein